MTETSAIDSIADKFAVPSAAFENFLLADIGVVKLTPKELRKAFGMISTESGTVLYFANHLRRYVAAEGEPEMLIPADYKLEKGDLVTLSYEMRPKGLRAIHVVKWDIEELQKVLDGERPPTKYRLVKSEGSKSVNGLHRGKPFKETVIWEGTNTREFARSCPISKYPVRRREFTDVRCRIERQEPGSSEWLSSRDPRR